jgi:putative Mn2+ efflux pump MntP
MDKNTIIGIIFLIISIDIISSFFKEKELKPINTLFNIILFSFAVSIDSFTVGVGLDAFLYPDLFITSIFMIVSFSFTYIGLTLGNKINQRIGFISQILGFILLFILSLIYLFK